MKTKQTFKKIGLELRKGIKSELPRILPLLAIVCFCGITAFAAGGDGAVAISQVTADIEKYVGPVKKLIYAIAAVIALVGAFNIYHKMTNGDQDVKKTVMLVLGGCIALLAMAEALPAMFV